MKLNAMIAGASIAGVCLVASTSHAATGGFILTYQGTVSTGQDDTNIFGLGQGASLIGQSITERMVVDYSMGANHDNAGAPYFRDTIGLQGFITSTVTINGATVTVGSQVGIDDRTDEHLDPGCGACNSSFSVSAGDETYVTTGDLVEGFTTFSDDLARGLDYHPSLALGPPIYSPADNLDFEGTFNIDDELYNQATSTVIYDHTTNAMFTPDTITITTFDSGVPEPAAWALMIGGFGLAGTALRRRRGIVVA